MIAASFSAQLAVVLAALVLAAPSALAQGTEEQRSACTDDAFKICASDIPDVPKIEACMERNLDKLTPACRAEFQPDKKSNLRAKHFR